MPFDTLWIGTSWKMNKLRAEARAFARGARGVDLARGRPRSSSSSRPSRRWPRSPTCSRHARARRRAERPLGRGRPLDGRDLGRHGGRLRRHDRRDRPQRAPHPFRRDGRDRGAEGRGGAAARADAARLRRRHARGTRGGPHRRGAGPAGPGRGVARLARETPSAWSSPTSRSGRSARAARRPSPASPTSSTPRIKAVLRERTGRELRVLYGGSVNPGNCVALAAQPHIDGLFIGRSAWQPDGFLEHRRAGLSVTVVDPDRGRTVRHDYREGCCQGRRSGDADLRSMAPARECHCRLRRECKPPHGRPSPGHRRR